MKISELIAANAGASNRLANAESLAEAELQVLFDHYCTLAELAQKARNLEASHSVEEAIERSEEKEAAVQKAEKAEKKNGSRQINAKKPALYIEQVFRWG